jgi:serine/threonine protein kinase
MVGKNLSHYHILEEVGRGGMGVVYKAHDKKLDRPVALKFPSPSALGSERDKERFEREAQAAAALSHPNIATVYEIDESELGTFIAMEFVEGVTLKELLEGGALSTGLAIDYGMQIAEALQFAHEGGVVHQDVKSANVIVTPRDQVKITDFGLALRPGNVPYGITAGIAGTAAYMSPEQIHGEKLDHRTDIWSFGVVLFEMLTGGLPFGEYEPVLIHFILNEPPPPLPTKRGKIPEEFQRIVQKCLEKDPADRYQTAADLVVDLRRLKRSTDLFRRVPALTRPAGQGPGQRASRTRRWAVAGVVVLSVVVMAVYAAVTLDPLKAINPTLPSAEAELEIVQFTSGGGIADFPSWSPEGEWLVYASDASGNLEIWKQRSKGGEPTRLSWSSHNESYPAWSPDGRSIACCTDSGGGAVLLIPSDGGVPVRIAEIEARPAWSPDAKLLSLDWNGNILLLDLSRGSSPRSIVEGTSGLPHTVWSPDGRHLFFWDRRKGDIYVIPSIGGNRTPLNLIRPGEEVSGLACSPDGAFLVFSRGQFGGRKNLWKVGIDPGTGMPLGRPQPITVATTDDVHCTLSPDGKQLAYTVRDVERQLWDLPLNSATGLLAGQGEQVTFGGRKNYYPAVSGNATMMAWTSQESDRAFIYFMNLRERTRRKLTKEWAHSTRETGASFSPVDDRLMYSSTTGGTYQLWEMQTPGSVEFPVTETMGRVRDVHPVISPDGGSVAFYSNRSGNWDVWLLRSGRQKSLVRLTSDPSNEMYPAWSHDGKRVSFTSDRERTGDIWIMDVEEESPVPFVVHPAEEGWSAWAPEGSRVYYTSNRSGAFNVWVKDIRGGEPNQVTDYEGLSFGLPEEALYTKFAVSATSLIVPLEERRGNIYVLNNPL